MRREKQLYDTFTLKISIINDVPLKKVLRLLETRGKVAKHNATRPAAKECAKQYTHKYYALT